MTRIDLTVRQVPPIRVMRIIARLNIGGPAIHVALLTAGLRNFGFETTLIAGQLGDDEADMSYLARQMGVEPHYIPSLQREINLLDDIKSLFALVRCIRQERPLVVHTHTAKAGLVGRAAARLCGVPIVVHTFHGHVFHGYFGWAKTQLFMWLERAAALLSDVVLTISDGLRDDLLHYHIASPERIRVLPLGLDLEPFLHLDPLRGMFRKELNLSTDVPLIGIIGRLVPVKNHELFLQAARLVRAVVPETHFVIVGDGNRRAALEVMCSELGLSDVVHFTGWRHDLPTIYADLNALVISSRNEGTPVSIIEGMAAGVPIVSTAVGGVTDVLQAGALGAMVDSDNSQEMAQAIIAALRRPEPECLEAARRWAIDRYGTQRLLEDISKLYLEPKPERDFCRRLT
jgi:glycosyltransferase involved in cell wall biosynthesis